jgi:hypothetical protein
MSCALPGRSGGFPAHLVLLSGREGARASKAKTGRAIKDPVLLSASFSSGKGEIHQEASWQLRKSE